MCKVAPVFPSSPSLRVYAPLLIPSIRKVAVGGSDLFRTMPACQIIKKPELGTTALLSLCCSQWLVCSHGICATPVECSTSQEELHFVRFNPAVHERRVADRPLQIPLGQFCSLLMQSPDSNAALLVELPRSPSEARVRLDAEAVGLGATLPFELDSACSRVIPAAAICCERTGSFTAAGECCILLRIGLGVWLLRRRPSTCATGACCF